MDPTACYRDMLASLDEGDLEAAREFALSLRRWLDRGGFCPHGQDGVAVINQLNQVLRDSMRNRNDNLSLENL